MPKVIARSEHRDFFHKGGDHKMYGKGKAGTASPGISGKESNQLTEGNEHRNYPKGKQPDYAKDFKFIAGGHDRMHGKGRAPKAVPGISGKPSNA